MTYEKWSGVDRYIAGLLVPPDPGLDAALADSDAAGLPAIAVSPTQGKLLMLLARIRGAKKILELGTLGGYSTIWLARGLPPNGKLITLEYEPKHAEVAATNIARAGLSGVVDIKVGRAIDTLPTLTGEAPFDLIFIDADKPSTPEYFEWSLKLSKPGTLIIVDNVVRDGEVANEQSRDANVIGIRQFYEMAANEPRVDGTAMQTVGVKGYDGFAILVVTGDR